MLVGVCEEREDDEDEDADADDDDGADDGDDDDDDDGDGGGGGGGRIVVSSTASSAVSSSFSMIPKAGIWEGKIRVDTNIFPPSHTNSIVRGYVEEDVCTEAAAVNDILISFEDVF